MANGRKIGHRAAGRKRSQELEESGDKEDELRKEFRIRSGFWILSEDRLLTPARPRYLLTPDSFFPLRLRRARSLWPIPIEELYYSSPHARRVRLSTSLATVRARWAP